MRTYVSKPAWKINLNCEKWDKPDANRLYSVVLTWKLIKGAVVFRKHDQFSSTACLKRTNFYSRQKKNRKEQKSKAYKARTTNFIREYFLTSFIFPFCNERKFVRIHKFLIHHIEIVMVIVIVQLNYRVQNSLCFHWWLCTVHFHLPSHCIRSKIHQTIEIK